MKLVWKRERRKRPKGSVDAYDYVYVSKCGRFLVAWDDQYCDVSFNGKPIARTRGAKAGKLAAQAHEDWKR